MARHINKLTDRGVKAQNKQGRYADGNGLYLQVSKTGSKSWLFRYMLDGKSREMGLGSLRILSLSNARKKAADNQQLLSQGIDPITDKNKKLALNKEQNTQAPTFTECTEKYLISHSASWKSEAHAKRWKSSVERYAYPIIGKAPIDTITRGYIMQILDPIWREKTETAKKLRGRLESIIDWATVQDFRKGENPARWKGHLDKLLPKPSELHKVQHFSALPYQDTYDFMQKLREREAPSAQALKLLILTATRSNEIRGATWKEFDLEKAIWTIPAERMKADKEHTIPLCAEAIEIIKALPKIANKELLFISPKSGKSLSDTVFKQLMKRMGITDITTHGFRSTFRDWAAEQTSFPREVIEHALAHQLKDKAEAAYFRSNLLDKRRELMTKWADYTKQPTNTSGMVIQLSEKR